MKKNKWDFIAPFLKPYYWMMNEKFSPRWEKKFTQLLAEHRFTDYDGKYTAKLGEFTIWLSNHPYAAFHPYGMENLPENVRPSRSTIHYARRRVRAELALNNDPYPAEPSEVEELRKMYEGSK